MKSVGRLGWTLVALAAAALFAGCATPNTARFSGPRSAPAGRASTVGEDQPSDDTMIVLESSSFRQRTAEELGKIRADVRGFLESQGKRTPGTYTVRLDFPPAQAGGAPEYLVVQLTIFSAAPVTYSLLADANEVVPEAAYGMDASFGFYSWNDPFDSYGFWPGYGYPYTHYHPVGPSPTQPGRHDPDDGHHFPAGSGHRPPSDHTFAHDGDRHDGDRHSPDGSDHHIPPRHTVAKDDIKPNQPASLRPRPEGTRSPGPARTNDAGSWRGYSSSPERSAPAYSAPGASSFGSDAGRSYSPPSSPAPMRSEPAPAREEGGRGAGQQNEK